MVESARSRRAGVRKWDSVSYSINTEVGRTAFCIDRVELGMSLQVSLQVVRRIAFVVDTAVSIQADPAQQTDVFFGRDVAKPFRGIKAAVSISQQSPDDDSINLVTPAPFQQCRIIIQK